MREAEEAREILAKPNKCEALTIQKLRQRIDFKSVPRPVRYHTRRCKEHLLDQADRDDQGCGPEAVGRHEVWKRAGGHLVRNQGRVCAGEDAVHVPGHHQVEAGHGAPQVLYDTLPLQRQERC